MTDLEGRLKAAMSAAVADTEPAPHIMELVRRRYRRRTAWTAVGAAAVVAVIAAAVPGIAALRDSGLGPPAAVPASGGHFRQVPATPAVLRQLWTVSQRVAAANGDARPRSVFAVGPVDHQRAERVLSGDIVYGHEQVYAVELRGHFTCGACSTPAGGRVPSGTVITVTIQVRTGTVLDFGLVRRWVPLGRLGQPFAVHP
jgi:hypothetical protein